MEKQQEPTSPSIDGDHSKQTSVCEECKLNTSKYRCPGCFNRSCSLPCVKAHKQRTGCTGKRPRTDFVSLSQFDDNLLISDYKFLEEAKVAAESAQRMRYEKFGSFHFKVPVKLKMLRNAAGRRHTRLLLLPKGMCNREKNQSRYVQKKDCIFWTIEWRFHSTDVVLIDHGVDENTKLCSIIEKQLQPGPWNHQLRPFCDKLDQLRFFIKKNPKGLKSPFCELDIKAPIRQQLANIIIIEYPIIRVYLPSDSFEFEISKDVNVYFKKLDRGLPPNEEQSSPQGVLFREEEIVDDDIADTQILDLMEYMNPEPLDNFQAVDKKIDRQVFSSEAQLDRVPQDMTPWLKNESQMHKGTCLSSSSKEIGVAGNVDFEFDQDLKDVYSGLMEQANPDSFLDLDGGSINEGFLGEIRDCLGLPEVLSVDNELEDGEIFGF